MPRLRLFFALFVLGTAGLVLACSFSSSTPSNAAVEGEGGASTDAGDCHPPPLSCDAPAPVFARVDQENNCIDLTRVQLADVCATSVNRCAPSGGVGPECAIAPDGTFYVGIESDNYMYSANGWVFDEPFSSIATTPPPVDQQANADQVLACDRAECLPSCDGGPNPMAQFASCPKDAGAD